MDTDTVFPPLMARHIDIFICPICAGALNLSANHGRIECVKCGQSFGCERGIPLLFWPNEWDSKVDVTEAVKAFYEENPFPGYDDVDSKEGLREKAEKAIYTCLLDDQIPNGARILEAGCGTGQLSNFLGIKWGRTVFATDICLNSLKLGQEFKEKNQIDNVTFFQMNLFRPIFRPESFQFVICNGVLHHTSNPFLGFQSILRLVQKGGYIIIGLYNTFGRIPTNLRCSLFKLTGNRFKQLDARLRDKGFSNKKKYTWFVDQYKNPHESKHTIGEVLSWFDQSGVEFVNSIPKANAFEPFSQEERLFKQNPRGTWLDHFFVQLDMLLQGGREGGFFIMIGQKKP